MNISNENKEEELAVCNNPFSMAIMEDSTNMVDTIVDEVLEFVFENYGLRIDSIEYLLEGHIDISQKIEKITQNTCHKLKIVKRNGKNIAIISIKSKCIVENSDSDSV